MKKKWNYPIVSFILFFLVTIILFLQFTYLSLSKKVYGIDMKEFALNRNTVINSLVAKRGTIYDVEGNVLAEDISSYTLIAYLDPKREKNYVKDKDYTANKLSRILGEENEEYILSRLNSNAKQVEFGSVGKNLTELTKLSIQELNLEGIDFIETVRRYYPNGNFASYIIGYAKQYDRINLRQDEEYDLYGYYKNYFKNYENVTVEVSDNKIARVNGTTVTALKQGKCTLTMQSGNLKLADIIINVSNYEIYKIMDSVEIGELGIESKYNGELEGEDGYTKYEQDKYGYKIPETNEETKEAINGHDIYLTIDSNIQRFAESMINEISTKYNPDYSLVAVMDAKSGDILASATSPSFNPNSLTSDMKYQNPLISYIYEPGSVMKIYTYMCAIETGLYDGEKTYYSGSVEFDDGTVIHDWNKTGWGTLKYDMGLSYSSNTAIISIIRDYLSRDKLRACLEKYGFGKKTDVGLSHEAKGSIEFKYETEIMSAGFGQGISTTAVQQLQGLTIIANNGYMVKPHIISKIVNTSTGEEEIVKVEKSEKLVSEKTITKIKDLMESVISPNSVTGSAYYMEGYDLIGKTGTAQISEHGKYLTGDTDYLVSVALMYPKDDPEIIVYALVKRPDNSVNSALIEPVKELIKNISKYRLMISSKTTDDDNKIKLNTYISMSLDEAKSDLENKNLKVIVIGNGDIVVNQYPEKDKYVIKGDKVFLITNSDTRKMIDLTNWSKSDASLFCQMSNIKCNFKGFGFVTSQSISSNDLINNKSIMEIELGNIKEN